MSDEALRIIGTFAAAAARASTISPPIGAERRRSHRWNTEWRRVGIAEQFCGLLARRHVLQHARNKSVFFEGAAIVAQRSIALRSPGDIAIEEFRQATPGCQFEIIERQIATHGAGHGDPGAL